MQYDEVEDLKDQFRESLVPESPPPLKKRRRTTKKMPIGVPADRPLRAESMVVKLEPDEPLEIVPPGVRPEHWKIAQERFRQNLELTLAATVGDAARMADYVAILVSGFSPKSGEVDALSRALVAHWLQQKTRETI